MEAPKCCKGFMELKHTKSSLFILLTDGYDLIFQCKKCGKIKIVSIRRLDVSVYINKKSIWGRNNNFFKEFKSEPGFECKLWEI